MLLKFIYLIIFLLRTMLLKFRISLLGKVNSSFPSHFCKEVAHREVAHREGVWCGARFVYSYGHLPAACRIITEYTLGPHVLPCP